jgi:hypothetical protein
MAFVVSCAGYRVWYLELLRAQIDLDVIRQAALLPPQPLYPVHALLTAFTERKLNILCMSQMVLGLLKTSEACDARSQSPAPDANQEHMVPGEHMP